MIDTIIFATMKFKNYLIIFTVLMAIQSCKNDIDINAPYKETAIVNGFLDAGTSQQYIRITKTFQNSANLTPQQAAQISDSLYFDTIIVNVIDLTSGFVFHFYKNTSIPKYPGYFASDKNILYYCDNMLPILGHVYKLTILNPKSGNTYTSQTSIVGLSDIMPHNSTGFPYTLDISYDNPYYKIQFEWSAAKNAAIYTAIVRYRYRENNDTLYTDQYVIINDIELKTPPYYYSFVFKPEQMNQFLINTLGRKDTADHSVYRKIIGVDYVVLAGSTDLKTAVDMSKPNTSLLQVKPEFSNVQNGIGLFTSRSTSTKNIPFGLTTPYNSEKNLTLNVKGFAQP